MTKRQQWIEIIYQNLVDMTILYDTIWTLVKYKMNAASNKATLWQYRRKKRRILSPVARGLIVGVLFTGWLTYSILYKQKFDFADEEVEEDKISQGMLILNSEEITNDIKLSIESSGVNRKIEGVSGQLSLLRKGK